MARNARVSPGELSLELRRPESVRLSSLEQYRSRLPRVARFFVLLRQKPFAARPPLDIQPSRPRRLRRFRAARVANIVSAIQMHDLSSATLSGMSNASNN